jgi:NTE family protein
VQTIIEEPCEIEHVAELDRGVDVVITSTDLASGYAFRISQVFAGNYTYGYGKTAPELRLWEAVAASAAVPGLFTPVQLPSAHFGLAGGPPVLSLTDGGVYDNLALEWFQGWDLSRRPPSARLTDFLVVVDSSGKLTRHPGTYRSLRALLRTRDVQYWMTRATRVRWLVEMLASGSLEGVLIGIRADPRSTAMPDATPYPSNTYDGALPSSLVRPLAGIRTDLDRFALEESGPLAYHGYWLCHARLANLYPALATSSPAWRDYANLSTPEEAALLEQLTQGEHRRLRRSRSVEARGGGQ